MKKRLKKLCALLLVAGVASGCVATRNSGASLDGLSAAHAADARALAEISAEQLAERHAPAHTALALARADGAFREYRNGLLQYRYYAGGKQMSIYGRSKSECWQKRNKLEHDRPSQITQNKKVSDVMTYREWADEWMRLYKEPAGHKPGI